MNFYLGYKDKHFFSKNDIKPIKEKDTHSIAVGILVCSLARDINYRVK